VNPKKSGHMLESLRVPPIIALLAAGLLSGCDAVPPGAMVDGAGRGPAVATGQMSAGSMAAIAPRPYPGTSARAPARPSQPPDLAQLKHYRHAPAEAMLREVLADLLRANTGGDRLPVSPHVAILDSSAYNAVLQNNRLYVTRGMLAMLNDKSELAAILAHELGHVLARHARSRVAAREQAIAAAADVAMTFRDPELTRRAIAVQQLSLAAFSREQEYEADRISIELMARAGYDPQGAIRSLLNYERVAGLFGRLTRLSPNRNVMRAASALATHPPTPERIARARRQVASLVSRSGSRSGRTERDAYLAAIEGLRFGTDGRGGFTRGRNFIHRGRDVAITMPPGYFPLRSRLGIAAIRRGGAAFLVFAPLKSAYGRDPETTLRQMLTRAGTPTRIEPLRSRRGAMALTRSASSQRRIAVVQSGTGSYAVIMVSKGYAGIDREFRSAVESVRPLSGRDREIARPLGIRIVRASGPGDIARYAQRSGEGDFGRSLLVALNGRSHASEIRPGMRIKVLVHEGRAGSTE